MQFLVPSDYFSETYVYSNSARLELPWLVCSESDINARIVLFYHSSFHTHICPSDQQKNNAHKIFNFLANFPFLKAHMVFFDENLGKTIGEAASKPDGLMVIGVLIQEKGAKVI